VAVGARRGDVGAGKGEVGVVSEGRLLLPGRVREGVALFAGGRETGVGDRGVAFWKSVMWQAEQGLVGTVVYCCSCGSWRRRS